MLLHLRDKLANRPTVGDDDSLAEKGSALGTADVEHIRQTRDIRERDVICRRSQRIRQTSAIDKKLQATLAASSGNILELLKRVQGPVLSGLGNVNQRRGDHMVARTVAFPRVAHTNDVCGRDLAFFRRDIKDLVTAAFNDSRLVHIDVSGVRGNDSLPGQEDRVDDCGICLGSADEEVDVRIGRVAGLADQVARTLAVVVGTVTACLLHVGGDQGIDDLLTRAFLIVTGEIRDYSFTGHCTIIARFLP